MKSLIKMNVFLVLAITLLSASWANAAGIGNNIVVKLAGVGNAYLGDEMFEQYGLEPLGAFCFDMDLIDAKTGNVIGTGSDCLSGITPGSAPFSMSLTATTFFHFPGGTLISQGQVTVQPVLDGSIGFTHITGAMPSGNNVIYGDGKFKNADGSVRLSGAVNLMGFGSGVIIFDCLFIIDI